MAEYRMTPARRAALEKAQAASARKRRKLATKSRRSRLTNRKTLALVAVGAVVAHNVTQQNATDPVEQEIVNRHVEVARHHNAYLNRLRSRVFPMTFPRDFDEDAARREAIDVLRKKKKKKT